jgi:pyrimidine-nucleoside phosphorylase/thymidine phosphorylase
MSKKLAESLDALVLDVKFGSGAFMQKIEDAKALAASLIRTGQRMQVDVRAYLTDMTQPLGRMIGNANEVNESIDILRGDGPHDTRRLTIELCASLLVQTKRAPDLEEARRVLAARIDDGSAWVRFQKMVRAQGARIESHLKLADAYDYVAPQSGFLQEIDGQLVGQAIIELGGGRRVAGQYIDHGVGIEMLVRKGEVVQAGQPMLRVFARSEDAFDVASDLLDTAIQIGDEAASEVPLYQTFSVD